MVHCLLCVLLRNEMQASATTTTTAATPRIFFADFNAFQHSDEVFQPVEMTIMEVDLKEEEEVSTSSRRRTHTVYIDHALTLKFEQNKPWSDLGEKARKTYRFQIKYLHHQPYFYRASDVDKQQQRHRHSHNDDIDDPEGNGRIKFNPSNVINLMAKHLEIDFSQASPPPAQHPPAIWAGADVIDTGVDSAAAAAATSCGSIFYVLGVQKLAFLRDVMPQVNWSPYPFAESFGQLNWQLKVIEEELGSKLLPHHDLLWVCPHSSEVKCEKLVTHYMLTLARGARRRERPAAAPGPPSGGGQGLGGGRVHINSKTNEVKEPENVKIRFEIGGTTSTNKRQRRKRGVEPPPPTA